MLFNRKFIAATASLFIAATSIEASNFSPQVTLQNAHYESQGFRILSKENIDNYSVRIKQPKSCETGVQVK
jgi:cathepsin A (carboxypeptidase C)